MAYGVKYYANYKSGNTVRTVHLLEDGFDGFVTEWFCTLVAPKESQGDSDTLFDEIIVSRVVRLEFLLDEKYDLTEFVSESRKFKCIIYEGAAVKFEGYLEPYETSRGYNKPYHYVQMTATCGLNRLKKNIFQQVEYNEGNLMLTYFELLNRCLDTIGIARNRRIGIHTYLNSSPSAPNPLLSVEVDVFRYFKDGVWADCQTIITDILVRFNAQLYVENNTYIIRSSADHVLGFVQYAGYSPDGTLLGIIDEWPNLIRDVNYENTGDPLGEVNSLAGGEVSLQPRVRKYTTEVDLGGKKDTFTNGGLQLWTPNNGPVGWEGNMPAALGGVGWTQVETGIVGAPYAMHIRGKAPQPYYTTHKKGIWPFRKTVKTPKEPEVWWESQKIEYNYKEVDSINVGFEYYTDDNSAGFLYAIAFFTQDVATGKISMSYVNPTNGGVRLESDYQLLTAPPHPRVNPTTGITQSKGVIEHTIDMSNAYTTKEIKTWIRVWFYYSVDEPGKTGDEYWIYKIIGDVGAAPEFEVPEGDSQFKSILESNPYESDEGSIINMITGDYSAGFLGTTMKMGALDLIPTGGWTRRGRAESISIYRACMADRIAFTYDVPDVIEASLLILEGQDISYTTILRFKDRSMTRLYKIVRLEFEHYRRIANITAIEMTYTEPPVLKQRSYTDARGLLDETTDGDTVYPGAGNTTGRVGIDGPEDAIEELQEDEITPEQVANGRLGVFEDVPPLIYTVKERSTAAVHLLDYLSVSYLETEQEDEELDEEEKHDPEDFTLSVVSMPTWVESVEIDKLSVYVTAKPTAVGEYSLTLSVIDDTFGSIPNVVVPIIVYPPVKVTYTLRDTSGLDPVDVAEIFNGAGFSKPEFDFDIKVTIDGHHEGWYGKLTTPDGVIMATIDPYSLVEGTDVATYIIGENVLAEIGLYQIDLGVYRNEGEEDNLRRVKYERIKFSFYDEATLGKAKFYLWGAESNTLIGPIKPDGSSAFENIKEAWDVKIDIAGVLHDAGTSVLSSEVGNLDTKILNPLVEVEDFTYFQFGEVRTEFDPSTYSLLVTLTSADPITGDPEVVYVRAISFTINHKPVQPTTGVLELGSIPANTINFDVIMELAGTGNSAALPTDGWSVRNKAISEPFNTDEWVLYRYVGTELVNVDISAYTGNPQTNTYAADGVTQVDSRLFGLLTSLQIGNPSIHKTPSTFRVINRRRMDGVIVAVYQADFSFGPAVPIDEVPIGGPATGTGGIVLEAGNGIFIAKDDEYNTINVLGDPDIFDFDTDPLAKVMRLKTNSIQLTHMAQLPSLSVIGNMTGAPATPTAVSVITSTTLTGASNSNLGSLLAIKTYIDNALTTVVSGTTNFFAKFLTAATLGVGLLSESGINVVANSGQFVSAFAPNVNPRGFLLSNASAVVRWNISKSGLEPGDNSGSDFTLARFNDAGQFLGNAITVSRLTGLATFLGSVTITGSGVVISTTSTTLNPNFNSDLLDGFHGVYYLDRANHTGTQLAATISDFAAAVRAVPLTGLSITSGAIVATDTILQAFGKIQGQLNTIGAHVGVGTVNYFPYYNTTTTLATSIMFQTATTVNVNGFMVLDIPTNANIRGVSFQTGASTRWHIGKVATETGSGDVGADFALWSYTDAGIFKTEIFKVTRSTSLMQINGTLTINTSGVVISTTSTTLNPNFNSDLLDGFHGVYYLDRANHTGTQLAATISDFSVAVRAVTLTGLSTVTNSPILATDTILQAFGKLQSQVNAVGGHVGAGTVNYFPYYNTTTTLATSIMFQSSTSVTVNGFMVLDIPTNANIRGLSFQTGASTRWHIGKVATETGSGDVGADFAMWAYSDAGTFKGEPFRISRSTMFLTLTGTLTIGGTGVVINTSSTTLNPNFNSDLLDGFHGVYYLDRANHTGTQAIATISGLQVALDARVTGSGSIDTIPKFTGTSSIGNSIMTENSGSIYVAGQLYSNVPHNSNVRGFNFQASSVARWSVGKAGTESGSNTGSDYVAWAYDDGGAFLREAFRISRANGNMTLAGGITVSGGNSGQWNTAYSWGNHAGLYAPLSHTHTSSDITNFTSSVRGSISGTGVISYNSSTGVISFTGSTGLSGSGTSGYAAFWSGSSSLATSTVVDNGSEINFGSGRSFGVEGPAAMRNYLHVWGYQANGTATNHGTIILHNLSSATIDPAAAIEILSTTRGFLNARMTRAQRLAISSVPGGLQVYQTDTVGASLEGLKLFVNGVGWTHVPTNTTNA